MAVKRPTRCTLEAHTRLKAHAKALGKTACEVVSELILEYLPTEPPEPPDLPECPVCDEAHDIETPCKGVSERLRESKGSWPARPKKPWGFVSNGLGSLQ